MSERVYTHMDKSTWGDGPWTDEPDKVQWVDETTDLDCLAVRNHHGAWCGYVGVPPGHAAHGVDYDNVRLEHSDDEYDYPDVHGGLTYADKCDEKASEDKGICHVPALGRPHDVWWLGFDCGHSMDILPAMDARTREAGHPPLRFGGESYRTLAYVRRECASLARQLMSSILTR